MWNQWNPWNFLGPWKSFAISRLFKITDLHVHYISFPYFRDFAWSPMDHLITYWVPEIGELPSKIIITRIPSRQEVATKSRHLVSEVISRLYCMYKEKWLLEQFLFFGCDICDFFGSRKYIPRFYPIVLVCLILDLSCLNLTIYFYVLYRLSIYSY